MGTDVHVEIVEYAATAYPDAPDYERHLWTVTVRRTGKPEMWAVTHLGAILTRGGNWSYRMPRNLRSSCYMSWDDATAAAVRAAATLTVNGWTVDAARASRDES